MPSFTPRLIATSLVARRDAERLSRLPRGEDLLLAILWEGKSAAARVLRDLGIADAIERELRSGLDESDSKREALEDVWSRASAQAARLGNDYVGTEHAVLAMAQTDGLAKRVFDGLEIGALLRERLVALLREAA